MISRTLFLDRQKHSPAPRFPKILIVNKQIFSGITFWNQQRQIKLNRPYLDVQCLLLRFYCATMMMKLFKLNQISKSRLIRNRCLYYYSTNSGDGDGPPSSGSSFSLDDIPKAYEPVLHEVAWIQKWMHRKSLNQRDDSPVFRMILPPPNVTGKLHLGHALTITIQDTIARWKTMQGYKLEWIPGFDHAGIATHTIAQRKIKSEGLNMEGVDLRKRIQELASTNLNNIKEQLQCLGALLNWESQYYTLDENHSNVVKEAFVQLFESGLIQRCDGIVNWSCSLQSSIADVEVDHVDFKGRITLKVPKHNHPIEFGVLYNCAYRLEDSDESLIVATSRPETMFGDVALAVNPGDSRYAKFIGKNVVNPVNEKVLPIIGDARVKTDFGTGIVKITPAHDKFDFAISSSHNLPKIDIITKDGYLNEHAEDYKGLPRFRARSLVLEALDKMGALKTTQEYSGVINICNRTGDVIEPKVLPHWFLRTQKLTNAFTDAIKSNEFIISPQNFAKDLLHTLSNCQDWCLSRQINWGHEIPVYRHINHSEEWVSALDKETAKKKIEEKYNIHISDIDATILQDSDVLDTWFSSSLIPVALSGWPDLKKFKEISLMETGNDILLYWVWRMVITNLALTNEFPFKHVLLHGIVSDKYGRKMSKSKGNVIDPLHVINGISYADLLYEAKLALESGELEKNEYDLRVESMYTEYPEGFKPFGRDALRFALLSQNVQAQQVNLDMVYLENCRHFTNKLWQALRFLRMHRINHIDSEKKTKQDFKPSILSITSVSDLWLLSCLYEFASDTEKHLDGGDFHLYGESIRKFFYQQLCDIYIELIKNDLKSGKDAQQHLLVLVYALSTGLKLSHPLIPYVTEEIWSCLGSQDADDNNDNNLLIDQPFPKSKELESFQNSQLNLTVLKTIKIVKEIRSLKTRTGIKPKSHPIVFVDLPPSELADINQMKLDIENLAGCKITFESLPPFERCEFITVITQLDGKICKISTPKSEANEKYFEGEKNKVIKLQIKLAKLKHQYENKKFQQNASPEVKEKLKKRLETLEIQINEVLSANPSSEDNKQIP